MRALLTFDTGEKIIGEVLLPKNSGGGQWVEKIERDILDGLNKLGGVHKVTKVHLLRN